MCFNMVIFEGHQGHDGLSMVILEGHQNGHFGCSMVIFAGHQAVWEIPPFWENLVLFQSGEKLVLGVVILPSLPAIPCTFCVYCQW